MQYPRPAHQGVITGYKFGFRHKSINTRTSLVNRAITVLTIIAYIRIHRNQSVRIAVTNYRDYKQFFPFIKYGTIRPYHQSVIQLSFLVGRRILQDLFPCKIQGMTIARIIILMNRYIFPAIPGHRTETDGHSFIKRYFSMAFRVQVFASIQTGMDLQGMVPGWVFIFPINICTFTVYPDIIYSTISHFSAVDLFFERQFFIVFIHHFLLILYNYSY